MEEKYKNLVKFLDGIDSTKLNEWENNFCQSVVEKLDKFDEHILLSTKQYETLRKIFKKAWLKQLKYLVVLVQERQLHF